MLTAGFWGLVSGSSLVIGAVIALSFRPERRIVGLVMGFGAGALISAVAYELVGDAIAHDESVAISIAMLLGAGTFIAGDWLIDRAGGGEAEGGRGPAIVLGAVLDGIPESFVLGLSFVGGGGASVALVAAIFLSNLPEALGATSDLVDAGWRRARVVGMWVLIMVVSALASAAGYAFFDARSDLSGVLAQGFAAGAILAMLTDTMVPESFESGGRFAGLATVLGFILAVALGGL
jgi:ZIP family zinc transporter